MAMPRPPRDMAGNATNLLGGSGEEREFTCNISGQMMRSHHLSRGPRVPL